LLGITSGLITQEQNDIESLSLVRRLYVAGIARTTIITSTNPRHKMRQEKQIQNKIDP